MGRQNLFRMPILNTNYDPTGTLTYKFFGSPTPQLRLSPMASCVRDCTNLIRHCRLAILVLSWFPTSRAIDELYMWAPTVFTLAWFTFWSVPQVPVVMSLLTLFVFAIAALSGILYIHDLIVWRVIQGPQLQVWPPQPPPGFNSRHRWVYINGVATGKTIMRQQLQCLSQTFHNPVLGVNNRTFGLMGDLFECIVQRAFGYRTKETGITYEIIKDYLNNMNVDKVIFVSHSQGGIIASQVLEDLYCEASPDELAKLEVYTFGSAALTFDNPWRDKSTNTRMIPVMEHYCNQRDMVTSWGALSSVDRDDLPFVGKVFVFENQTGHMLNQHYLRHMFSGPERTWKSNNFQLRAIRRDPRVSDKFFVTGVEADPARGQESVQSLSKLWKYM